ncbi:MAG TPA: CAP domain-containing protein, partial [Woeseiaceae bacterium]|nr:CAP domain-containing protein [Woeseiaceae bacterium]
DGSNFAGRATAAGFTGSPFGELITATSETDPYAAFEMWRNSDLHRNLMLASQIDSIGVGFAESNGQTLWSVTLGDAPASSGSTPVPEPPALALVIVGLLSIRLMHRRTRRA